MKKSILAGLRFLLTSFAPLLVYYAGFRLFGPRPAAALGLLAGLGELAIRHNRGDRLNAFFKFSLAMTVVFGVLDVALSSTLFLRFEGAITNVFQAAWWGGSVILGKPILLSFYERNAPRGEPQSRGAFLYMSALTAIWAAYFLGKGLLYAWLATRGGTIGNLILVRALVGNASLAVMIVGEILVRKPIFRAMRRSGLHDATAVAA